MPHTPEHPGPDQAPTMTAEQAGQLRAPFAPEHVGLLPRTTCKACSNANSGACSDHPKIKCAECGNYLTPRHMHIDYVGHGAVTDRLLAVDPGYQWEPLTWEGEPWKSLPAFVYDAKNNPVTLWITLTVCGVTRLGVGTCPSGQFEAEKVLIGDALRNAAMRFGVALDLWIKGQAEDDERNTQGRRAPDREPEADPGDLYITEDLFHQLSADMRALPEPQREALAERWLAMPDLPRDADTGRPSVRLLRRKHLPTVLGLLADEKANAAAERASAAPHPDSAGQGAACPVCGGVFPDDAGHQCAPTTDLVDVVRTALGDEPAPNGDAVRHAEIEAEVKAMSVAAVRQGLRDAHLEDGGTASEARARLVEHRLSVAS